MTNNDIVKDNFGLIQLCVSHQMRIYGTPGDLYDDIVQDICMILLEYDNEKLNKIQEENHMSAFITGILVRQLYSTNSAVYRTYRRLNDNSDDISAAWYIDNDYSAPPRCKEKKEKSEDPISIEDYNVTEDDSDFMVSVKESLDKLSIGELSIFLNYAESGNISKLARQMKVPQALLAYYIGQVKNKIKQNIIEREYD